MAVVQFPLRPYSRPPTPTKSPGRCPVCGVSDHACTAETALAQYLAVEAALAAIPERTP